MMWAPETTWVEDYYGEGRGAFVDIGLQQDMQMKTRQYLRK